jgi:hypothetical protein
MADLSAVWTVDRKAGMLAAHLVAQKVVQMAALTDALMADKRVVQTAAQSAVQTAVRMVVQKVLPWDVHLVRLRADNLVVQRECT